MRIEQIIKFWIDGPGPLVARVLLKTVIYVTKQKSV